jgi:adenosylhomocysteine nucleosidase
MLLINCALMAEARPLIDFYRLKQSYSSPFRVWKNDNISIIVTGTGNINVSSAISYLYGKEKDISLFLNIGIAGHRTLDIGNIVLSYKIKEKANVKNIIYPSILFDLPMTKKPLLSVDKPSNDYIEDYCFDMEGYSFFHIATKFLPIELVHCLKIISDNEQTTFFNIDEKTISTLVFQNIDFIDNYINKILPIGQEYQKEISFDFSKYYKNWSFSSSQKQNLKDVVSNIKALNDPKDSLSNIGELKDCKNAKEVINTLEKKEKKAPII